MQFTIPAQTPAQTYGDLFNPFCDWLRANQIDPEYVDGSQLLTVTSGMISGTMHGFGPFSRMVTTPMPELLAAGLESVFFAGNGHPSTQGQDADSAPMDDMAQLIKQLAEGRAKAAEGKKQADEARDQILARLRQSGKEYGSVAGQRVLHAKTLDKRVWNGTRFKADHPEMVEAYTDLRKETRLEIL